MADYAARRVRPIRRDVFISSAVTSNTVMPPPPPQGPFPPPLIRPNLISKNNSNDGGSCFLTRGALLRARRQATGCRDKGGDI